MRKLKWGSEWIPFIVRVITAMVGRTEDAEHNVPFSGYGLYILLITLFNVTKCMFLHFPCQAFSLSKDVPE